MGPPIVESTSIDAQKNARFHERYRAPRLAKTDLSVSRKRNAFVITIRCDQDQSRTSAVDYGVVGTAREIDLVASDRPASNVG